MLFLPAGPPPLTGVMTVPPGCLGGLDGASVRLWSPEAFARTPTRCVQDARRDLRQTLDLCVAALAGRRAVGIEISGGLDSAIVGGALSALGRPVVLALNTRAAYAETDERRYAQAVAKMMGVDLTCRRREAVAYSAEMFEATAGDAWPSQNGRDLANDRLVAGACKDASLDTLLTGKGGDALFFQMPTPLAFVDLWWDRPLRSLMSGQLPGVARWTRTSTWSLIRTARQSRRDACEDLPPGKRLQIDAIAGGVADAVRAILGLDDGQGDVGLVVEHVVGALAFAARDQLAAHDDAALGKAHLLTDLRRQVPARRDQGGGDELGADVAFAEGRIAHSANRSHAQRLRVLLAPLKSSPFAICAT